MRIKKIKIITLLGQLARSDDPKALHININMQTLPIKSMHSQLWL